MVTPGRQVNGGPAQEASADEQALRLEEGDGEHASTIELKRTLREVENRARWQQAILANIVDGVVVADENGKLTYFNSAAEELLGVGAVDIPPDEWSTQYGIYRADGITMYTAAELPLARALRGEVVIMEELIARSEKRPDGVWLAASTRPIITDDGQFQGAVGIFRDISDRKRWEKELAHQLALEKERNESLERMRLTIQQLSTPILEVWDEILVLPIIGVLDSRRSGELTDQLLAEVARKQCRFVIIDITGVEIVDSATADRLIRLVSAVELLGARCVLTGVRPSVAQTLVALNLSFGSLLTLRNLRHGLQTCLRQMITNTDTPKTNATAAR